MAVALGQAPAMGRTRRWIGELEQLDGLILARSCGVVAGLAVGTPHRSGLGLTWFRASRDPYPRRWPGCHRPGSDRAG
jgi:hypothetical protein